MQGAPSLNWFDCCAALRAVWPPHFFCIRYTLFILAFRKHGLAGHRARRPGTAARNAACVSWQPDLADGDPMRQRCTHTCFKGIPCIAATPACAWPCFCPSGMHLLPWGSKMMTCIHEDLSLSVFTSRIQVFRTAPGGPVPAALSPGRPLAPLSAPIGPRLSFSPSAGASG